jgi:hypothetical protein
MFFALPPTKVLLARAAFPDIARGQETMLDAIAIGAGDAIRPADGDEVFEAISNARKVFDGVHQCLWLVKFFFHKCTSPNQGG